METTPSPQPLGGNAPVNDAATDPSDIDAHNSPSVAQDPTDADNVVVANRIDTPEFSCALHVSTDGGATWAQKTLRVPEGGGDHCYAPDPVFDSQGRLYVAYATLAGEGNRPEAIWLVRSDDGGKTLSRPDKALGELAFQVRLTADPNEPGRLYLTWLQAESTVTLGFPEAGYPIQAARSDNGGQSWSDPVEVNESDRERVVAPSPAIGPDGQIYVAYIDLGDDRLDYHGGHEGRGGPPYQGEWELVVAQSDDGASWSESAVDDGVVPTERLVVFLPSFPSIAVGEGGQVYTAFHDGRFGDADVLLWRSADEGATWQGPVRVNDTPKGDGTSQYLPQLATAANGRVDVTYYDRRGDPDNVMNDVSLQSSADGGETFSEHVDLAEESFDSRIGFGSSRDMADLGSRLGLLSTDEHALAVWTDTRAGRQASGKQDLTRQLVGFPPGPYLNEPTRAGLWYGGQALALAGLALLLWTTARWLIESRTQRRPMDKGGNEVGT